MAEPYKYWYQGLPLPAVNQTEDTGSTLYWWSGLPVPVLVESPAPPVSTWRAKIRLI